MNKNSLSGPVYGSAVYGVSMYTVIETDIFKRCAGPVWTDAERLDFITGLQQTPLREM